MGGVDSRNNDPPKKLEHFLIFQNREGFPGSLICDSRCGLEKEASLHGKISFYRSALHSALQKLQCSPAIPPFRVKNLEHFTFVINRPPETMRLTIDPHENLVQASAPARIRPVLDTPLAGLGSKQRAEAVPTEPARHRADRRIALTPAGKGVETKPRITAKIFDESYTGGVPGRGTAANVRLEPAFEVLASDIANGCAMSGHLTS